jgi:hypothetical protein
MSPVPELLIKIFIAVLKIPRSIPKAIQYFKGILDKMSNDPRYSGLQAKLTTFETNIGTLDEQQSFFKEKPPKVSKQDRDDAFTLVATNAKSLCSDVQQMAYDSPSYAESIITGANMSVKVVTKRQKQKPGIKDTNESGTIEVLGEGEGYHEWQQSEDGTHWTALQSTSKARLIVSGLTPGKKYYFRSRQILTKGEYGPWSTPWDIIVR